MKLMWLRHGVDSWHLDCEINNEKHDFIASITRKNSKLELYIPSSNLTKTFHTIGELNEFLKQIGIATAEISTK